MRQWMVLLSLLLLSSTANAATYFVDFTGGLDANAGTSSGAAWKTITKVNATAFSAGDSISFKRGEVWSGIELVIDSSGTSGNPVTYQAYGTGAAPIIQTAASHQTSGYTRSVLITGDWNVFKDFLLRNGHEAGVDIQTSGANNTISDNEFTAVGIGVLVRGDNNLITRNYAHDLTMIEDNNNNSDYGAVGFWIQGGDANELSYNRCVNCRAPSLFYVFDGGMFEISGTFTGADIHHNWAEDSNGFLEGGSGTVSNIAMSYNVIYNVRNSPVVCLNTSETISNITFENNTVYVQSGDASVFRVFACRSDWSALSIRNNIFYSDVQMTQTGTPGTHTHNRYHMVNMVNGSGVGYALGTGETTGNPLFVNPAMKDFHLQISSAARDTGTNLGYTLDFEGRPVPVGAAPDMGAYEYGEQRCELTLTLD